MSLHAIAVISIFLIIGSIVGLGTWLQFRDRIEAWLAGRKRRKEVAKALESGELVTDREERLKGVSQSISKPYRLRQW